VGRTLISHGGEPHRRALRTIEDAPERSTVAVGRFVKVARRSELPENDGTYVEVEGNRIALFNLDGGIYAIDNTCTHVGGPLSLGLVKDDEVECPWHGSRFDIKTGEVRMFPAKEDVATYRVRVMGDDVEVEV
jgi:3-phenylpropionate/trans-cinnamate dioxygenase ferredoxin component